MHTTSVASIAGQLSPGTIRGASASILTAAAHFAIAQTIMLTMLASGEMALSLLVAPRAIKAPGNATTAAP